MIINAHLHLIELSKVAQDEKSVALLKSIPSFANLEDTVKLLSIENVIKQMDEAGIEKSVIFALYAPILYASNEFVTDICRVYPDRFIGFASVDPKVYNAAEILEKAVLNLGLKGLKFHPPLQDFFPNDRMMWPIYEKAVSLNIPVVFHVGSTPFGSLCKLSQADPMLLDEVAIAFPKLKIVITHLGTLWHNESFMVAEKNPNVYIDTTAYPYEIKQLLTKELVERVGTTKFIFGTDFPMPYEGHVHKMKDYVDCINSLDLSQETKDNIFYRNFQRIYE